MPTPEDKARAKIDQALETSGWKVPDTKLAHLKAGREVALRKFPLWYCPRSFELSSICRLPIHVVFRSAKTGIRFATVETKVAIREQGLIVVEVGRHLSVMGKLEAAVGAYLTCTDRLRQSTSHQAFLG